MYLRLFLFSPLLVALLMRAESTAAKLDCKVTSDNRAEQCLWTDTCDNRARWNASVSLTASGTDGYLELLSRGAFTSPAGGILWFQNNMLLYNTTVDESIFSVQLQVPQNVSTSVKLGGSCCVQALNLTVESLFFKHLIL